MQITELVKALNKVQQVVGDVPVFLKDLEHDASTVIHTLDISLDPTDDSTNGKVTIAHGAPAAVIPGQVAAPAGTEPPAV